MPTDSKEKMEYIVTHYRRLMYSAANEILRDPYEAEDACQETLLKLCKVLDRIVDVTTASARAYVMRSLRNTACDMVRKNSRQIPVEQVYDEMRLAAVYDGYPSDTGALIDDIRELPEIYRSIIRMRCLEEKSSGQIAEELHTSVGTVNSRLCRARELLRKKWAGTEAAVCGA